MKPEGEEKIDTEGNTYDPIMEFAVDQQGINKYT